MPTIFSTPEALVRAFVRPRMHVHIASTISRPHALMYALARTLQGSSPELTISLSGLQGPGHALTVSGIVGRLITSFVGENYPSPGPSRLYADLLHGRPFPVEIWSLLSLLQRLWAGAMGLPYCVTRSLVNSDLTADKEGLLYTVADPADPRQTVALVKPLHPDLTLVHGICADDRGNVILGKPYGEGAWSTLAATYGALVTVERIVPRSVIDRNPDLVMIPGHRVLGLCEARFGAHPHSLRTGGLAGIEGYQDDYPFLAETARRCADSLEAHRWYADWVDLTGGHPEYLAKLGSQRVHALTRPMEPECRVHPTGDPGPNERLIALAARKIVALVTANRYDTILAGIGTAHIASWVAARRLAKQGVTVRVIAELGLYGLDPFPGDVHLFGKMHMDRCQQLTGTLEVLGALATGRGSHCLGVLGAAEIDVFGNLNTMRSASGRFLVGSGGANDIASTADCVAVVREGRQRLVKQVAHRTSPGSRVGWVITPFGRFGRTEPSAPLRLESWLPAAEHPALSPGEGIRRWSEWPEPDGPVATEPSLSREERELIWELDPRSIYR